MKMSDGTYLCCPKCDDEDASEEQEAKAIAGDLLRCRSCGEEFEADYDGTNDKFIVRPRAWTR